MPFQSLTPDEEEHFLTKGWLRVPGAIKQEYIDKWMKDLWVRVDYDEHDKTTWHTEYLHLPRHREVTAEEFAPKAWEKIVDICGGEDKIDPVRERYYGDAFIINFGTEEKAPTRESFEPREQKGWHTDDDWYRMFLDSSGNALTVIHVFTDISLRPSPAFATFVNCRLALRRLEGGLSGEPSGKPFPPATTRL